MQPVVLCDTKTIGSSNDSATSCNKNDNPTQREAELIEDVEDDEEVSLDDPDDASDEDVSDEEEVETEAESCSSYAAFLVPHRTLSWVKSPFSVVSFPSA